MKAAIFKYPSLTKNQNGMNMNGGPHVAPLMTKKARSGVSKDCCIKTEYGQQKLVNVDDTSVCVL